MRISELAREAATPLTAVKYYQREGLLPAGEKTAPNQTAYDRRHVERVRLVRALLETGGLSIAVTKQVLAVLDTDDAPLAEVFEVAQYAITDSRSPETPASRAARARIEDRVTAAGWCATTDNPGHETAARALDGLATIGFDAPDDYLDAYMTAAATAARADVAALQSRDGRDAIAELMVIGTVLGDPLFAGLRRIAQQDATHDVFPVATDGATS
ncbi:DNA-binding transcriptional MerR regulator [Curtobacterium flaccumfaciens]|uniref:DNA-binding transcriptional MerR regulator n=1 Tax=Curtobacterium salicis TaxID=1779862 RepID=A0ABX0T6W8_9MICO|nr:DNA-binding transcriptional MerR regulator [Curtobacterium sp. WW7]